jgi:hypothetical protein
MKNLLQINTPEFNEEVIRKVNVIEKYTESIEKLIMNPNSKLRYHINMELVKFINEYNQ